MKHFYILSFLFLFSGAYCQTLFEESFDSGNIPQEWTNSTFATDGGWRAGTNSSLSSAYFPIPSNNSNTIVATNDDQCNCNKSSDRLITPAIDLSSVNNVQLSFDVFYTDATYQGAQENASVQVSTDKINWTTVSDLEGLGTWTTHRINLDEFAGMSEVYISFFYNDGGGWVYGMAIDNVKLEVPPALEATMVSQGNVPYAIVGQEYQLSGLVTSNGTQTITNLEISYQPSGGQKVTESFDNLSIESFDSEIINFNTPWVPSSRGDFSIDVTIEEINGDTDVDISDNSFTIEVQALEDITRPNIVRDIIASTPKISTVATSANQLDKPTDLDFFPLYDKDELWIVNERNENSGGSTLTISDASESPTNMWHRVDGNAWHFMSLPTGIAFSDDNYNFATSPGVRDANHSGGTFTGPSLWSSDPAIYAQPSGGNGSHLDMLHGSPFSMGIAHEVDNVFWVYDNFNNSIVRYDFVNDHGPGNDFHGDALVRRFNNMGINGDGNIPNHMILDKDTGWLYFVDNGNDRVMRLDINSGSSMTPLVLINEGLTEHSAVNGFNFEVIIENLDQPCGIEIIDNLLLVGEYGLGDIIVYDMDNDLNEIGRIETGLPGLTGIKVGPRGNIWYTNRLNNTANKIEVGDVTSIKGLDVLTNVDVYPNPSSGIVRVSLPGDLKANNIIVELSDINGRIVMKEVKSNQQFSLDYTNITNGIYQLHLRSDDHYHTSKLVITK